MSVLPKIGNKVSLTQRAYDTIKDAIIMNYFKPGDILSEERLADELAISRTPVRSALKMLSIEHLIVLNPSKNVVVSDISPKDVQEVTIVRSSLETTAVSLLASTISENQIIMLKSIVNKQEKAVQNNDYQLFIKFYYEFHVVIGELTNNKWLFEMIKNVNTIMQRYLILSGTLKQHSKKAICEHYCIIDKLEKGDANAAEAKMREHLNNVNEQIFI
ncbi:GntR family transcriptional regulator [Clostridium oryzae]|uniref:HTH-type transcriptional regulator McbR n=1 Tax=Clostridium oryzae TaxID=1450648 RepID=A0A1V4IH63_9CLOT|nr:GntR family transcriptional regulator [Clostridium oryzae]OPJ59341.1 HTH-type transcriptional regulator McbR [Clostridium oryzae]